MYVSWRERLMSNPSLRDIKMWPHICLDDVPEPHRKGFIRNKRIAALASSGKQVNEVAQICGVDRSYVSRLMTRTLGGQADEEPPLSAALIPRKRLRKHQRRASIDLISAPSGHQNAFGHVLDSVPKMRAMLDHMLIEHIKDKPNAQVASPAAFFGEFKRLLAEANWPIDSYPYTTASCAQESVRRYYHERLNALTLETSKAPVRVIEPSPQIRRAFRTVQIDAQLTDLKTSIHMELNGELTPLRISRVSLLKAVDVDTNCVLAYHLAMTGEPNQEDLLQLLENLFTPWQPMTLHAPGLSYLPGSGFSSLLDNGCLNASTTRFQLDNALAHLATSVSHVVCEKLGAVLNLGLPKAPKGRNWVEAAFRKLSQSLQRFPSTTGSHPHDTIKESAKNQKKPPKISLRMLEETLSVMLSAHNVTPRAELANDTPLNLLRRHVNQHYVPMLPDELLKDLATFQSERVCNVIYLKNERRMPFIRFAYTRYQGTCLHDSNLVGKKIKIRFDRRDIRSVQAFSLEGELLGSIYAPKSWQRFAHSLSTRKRIFKEMKTWKCKTLDPLAEYFHRLLMDKHIPTKALEMLRVYRDSNRYVPMTCDAASEERCSTPDENSDQNSVSGANDTASNSKAKRKSKIAPRPWSPSWTNKRD